MLSYRDCSSSFHRLFVSSFASLSLLSTLLYGLLRSILLSASAFSAPLRLRFPSIHTHTYTYLLLSFLSLSKFPIYFSLVLVSATLLALDSLGNNQPCNFFIWLGLLSAVDKPFSLFLSHYPTIHLSYFTFFYYYSSSSPSNSVVLLFLSPFVFHTIILLILFSSKTTINRNHTKLTTNTTYFFSQKIKYTKKSIHTSHALAKTSNQWPKFKRLRKI